MPTNLRLSPKCRLSPKWMRAALLTLGCDTAAETEDVSDGRPVAPAGTALQVSGYEYPNAPVGTVVIDTDRYREGDTIRLTAETPYSLEVVPELDPDGDGRETTPAPAYLVEFRQGERRFNSVSIRRNGGGSYLTPEPMQPGLPAGRYEFIASHALPGLSGELRLPVVVEPK